MANMKRAANRRGSKIAHRYPEHNEQGYRGGNSSMKTHGSPASLGASMGPGPMPGAGELHSPGSMPGPAAKRIVGISGQDFGMSSAPTAAPKGMRVYQQGSAPPKGYRQ